MHLWSKNDKDMKITSDIAIFQVIYVVHWNNFRIYILSTSKKRGASVASDNDIYYTGIIFLYIC